MEDKKITLELKGEEISFVVSTQAHRNYINSVKESNKVAPTIRFLNECVIPESKIVLEKYIDWYFLDIAGMLLQEIRPELEITVKK